MIQFITAGMALGLLGSFHCVGMCGPLALSLPVGTDNIAIKFLGTLVYNAGRVVTYSFFGLLFGIVGRSFAIFGFQQALSITMGSLILLFLLTGKRFSRARISIPGMSNYFLRIRNALGSLFLSRNFNSLFFIGLLNGLLPCGLVYMAVAGAIAAGGVYNSVIFMASFGLGTLPVMWAVAFFGNNLPAAFRTRIRNVYPYIMAVVACLLILRGMGLGIPYISPKGGADKKEMQVCVKP